MEAICTGAIANIISTVVSGIGCVMVPLFKLIDDVIHLDRNTVRLQDEISTKRVYVENFANEFQHQQRSIPGSVNDGLQSLQRSLDDAERVINLSKRRQGCLDRRLCKPRVCRQIRKCKIIIDECYNNLQRVISDTNNVDQLISEAPLRPEASLQPVPESGFVGTGIESAEKQLNTWLNMEDRPFLVLGVYGMGGIGKTSLLRKVYNTYKIGGLFEKVIWLTVSQKFDIHSLQSDIAKEIYIELDNRCTAELRKRNLYAHLKENKFLLILDDLWNPIQLEELGIPVDSHKSSKVVISSRRIDVIRNMGPDDSYSIPIRPLSSEEGRQLFFTVAFKDGGAPEKSIEDIAIQIAEECKGLPLAIKVVAAALIGSVLRDWRLALDQMKIADPGFRTTFNGIEERLYKPLKFSYDCLPDSNYKNCFLYCGAFAEDEKILVERLVEMWIGEGLVYSRDKSHLMDVGRRYVTQLVERCLFEYASTDMEYIKVHDVLRDMALHIAEEQEKCLFRTSQKLDEFPGEQVMDDCKRIAIRYYNDHLSAFLPTDFRCPRLGTLILAENKSLREVPNGFLLNLSPLRVLDLSWTNITSLPESTWDLKQLEFLNLSDTSIEYLSEGICNLYSLQFLLLSHCRRLKSLPCKIGKLKNLKHLNLNECESLTEIPVEISQLNSLNKLELWDSTKGMLNMEEADSGVCSLKDFKNFPNLMELSVRLKTGIKANGIEPAIKVGTMEAWLEMRHLRLGFDVYENDVMEDLPEDMQNMKNLQTFRLDWYLGISLPNCICDLQQLENLSLIECFKLRELPPLERLPNLRILSLDECNNLRQLGITGRVGAFPTLEHLTISDVPNLESISSFSSSNVVWTEGTMPKLQILEIHRCPQLKRLGIGIEKLPNLKRIEIDHSVHSQLVSSDDNFSLYETKIVNR